MADRSENNIKYYERQKWYSVVLVGNLETESSKRMYGDGQIPRMRGEGQRITIIVERSRNTEVVRGAEEQMAAYQRGNSNQEDTYCQKCH